MFKLTFYVPTEDKERVKKAIFDAGAGRIGNYDSCCFELDGVGQFRALEGSNPHIGEMNKIEIVKETRVELVCECHLIKDVVDALKKSHPYETPAYDVIKIESI